MIFELPLSYFEDTKAWSTTQSCETQGYAIRRKTEIWTQGPKLATLCYIPVILILYKFNATSTANSFTLAPLDKKKKKSLEFPEFLAHWVS